MTMLLEIDDLWVAYDHIQAVRGVSFSIASGEIVTLIGANGAGKSTILRAISGLQPITSGGRYFAGQDLSKWSAHQIAQNGIAHVPEGRGVFGNLTVLENLRLAAYGRRDNQVASDLDRVLTLFPRLAERRCQWGGTLSGGEQQMLAVGRALMRRGQLLLLDEPSMGLAPFLVKEIFKIISEINRQGTTILLVEQNAYMSLKIAHRGYVLETGEIILSGDSRQLLGNPLVQKAYLGH
ncbi:ABC transporter related protein [Desulfobacca acetoxidans DSM 11109]|uniref:ABC transporter related protein n=2 Tax=Desulfobacca acetoxidans TaxID=60893 RepID=F2NEK8_DESAR|nr:ABC transporter related protein [Desulfobacca acetoxidans DSM 11109]